MDRLTENLSLTSLQPGSKALAAVIATTELLEHILLDLPMRDLLLAQRINKRFKHLIDDSIAIQRALYFTPSLATTADGEAVVPIINPLLQNQMRVASAPVISTIFGFVRRPLIFSVDAVIVSYDTSDPGKPPTFEAAISITDFCRHTHPSIVGVSEATKCFPQGSWRRMLATQPPCALDSYSRTRSSASGTGGAVAVTMGRHWEDERYIEAGSRTVAEYVELVEEGRSKETWEPEST